MTTNARLETALAPSFVAADVEAGLVDRWDELGVNNPDNAPGGSPAFTLVIPPPNVTGQLHMGHALGQTIMDAVVRRKRMQGYAALFLPGTDHAGIATQTVVERMLVAETGVTRIELGREEFVKRVWAWKDEYGSLILNQQRRLGESVDWSRLRFTMDEGLSRAVRTVFKRLFDEGLIYRAERLVNWSPALRSAISDIEVEYKDVPGELVTFQYGPLQVATTRLETMLGDTALAVHPDDERYAHLVGTEVEMPITHRLVPVVADTHVDPEFGTGVVKVTPAHDPNDFAIGQRHGLPSITVLDETGSVTGTRTVFDGMDRIDARRAIREQLEAEGLVVTVIDPYVHSVGHDSRTGVVIEPRLSLQWFVKVEALAQRAGDAVRDGETSFVPAEMAKRYFDWVDDMHDWCISRQLWWGHRIPIWYGPNGEVVCPNEGEEPTGAGWEQDVDVLDTWFSSALWPASTLGWPDMASPDLARHYPTDVLVTGYDIVFFWVARMMMFCTYVLPGVPFKEVTLHGLVRDASGAKMSKSKGNVVNPLDWVDRYGADSLRFSLMKGANPGSDVPVSEEWVRGAAAFANKIWNATRFALISGAVVNDDLPTDLSVADRWILSRLQAVIAETDAYFEGYEMAKAADGLYHFAWDEVFDWYLELCKAPFQAGGREAEVSREVLGHVVESLLRLLHPVMPFLTERLWTTLTHRETVVTAAWPTVVESLTDAAAEAAVAGVQQVVTEVRRFRSGQQVKPSAKLPAVVIGSVAGLTEIGALANLLPLEPADAVPAGWSEVVVGAVTVGIDLSGTVDVEALKARAAKDLVAAQKELEQTTAKLGSPAAAKAPEAVVATWRDRQAAAQADVDRLTKLLA